MQRHLLQSLAIGALLTSAAAAAQSPTSASDHTTPPTTGIAAVDSATAARDAWARAVQALEAGDAPRARREVARAAAAWPAQPAYAWGAAVLAAQAVDTAGVRDALGRLAAIGVSHPVRGDARFAAFLGVPDVATLVARLDTIGSARVRSTTAAVLPDSTFWPEGMDYDPRTRRFYVASVRHGTIAVIDPSGASRELWPRSQPHLGSVLGVRVDTAAGVLWATLAGLPHPAVRAPGDSAIAALVRVRLADGVIERRWDLAPVPGGHLLGDLAVGPAGDVWLTDSQEPVLYRLRRGADTLERVRHPLFHSLQGMAPTPDGKLLFVADYSHGLLRVDLAARGPDAITRVADAPASTTVGCDGIAWDRGAIVCVQNGVTPPRVMRFALDAAGRRVVGVQLVDQNLDVADEPTIGAVVGDAFVYVADSQWDAHDDAGALRPGAKLRRATLLRAPLPR